MNRIPPQDSKSSMLGLANAICSALAKSRNVMDGAPGFHDILCLTYPKASREEIDFLARSAEELRESQKEKTGLPARILSWEEVRLSMQVFDMMNKNDMGMVSITHLIHQMLLAFPDINESAVSLGTVHICNYKYNIWIFLVDMML